MKSKLKELVEWWEARAGSGITAKAGEMRIAMEIMDKARRLAAEEKAEKAWDKDKCGHWRARCAMDNTDCDGECGEHASRKLSAEKAEKPKASASLVEEIERFSETWCNPFWKEKIAKVLSKYKGAKPAEEGLREAVSKCPTHNNAIDTYGADSPNSHTCPEEKNGCIDCPITKAFLGYSPSAVHSFIEMKGESYPVCSKCGIVARRDGKNGPCKGPKWLRPFEKELLPTPAKAEEPLAVESLADLSSRKGFDRIRINNFRGGWHIRVMNYHDETEHKIGPWDTYPECEAKARAFLMGLPDKGEMK